MFAVIRRPGIKKTQLTPEALPTVIENLPLFLLPGRKKRRCHASAGKSAELRVRWRGVSVERARRDGFRWPKRRNPESARARSPATTRHPPPGRSFSLLILPARSHRHPTTITASRSAQWLFTPLVFLGGLTGRARVRQRRSPIVVYDCLSPTLKRLRGPRDAARGWDSPDCGLARVTLGTNDDSKGVEDSLIPFVARAIGKETFTSPRLDSKIN